MVCGFDLRKKCCERSRGCFVMKRSERDVVAECGITFFIYLSEVVDEILSVVAVGSVLERAKSGVRISIVVFTAACWRTADTFATNIRACGDILSCLTRGLDK